MDMGESRWTGIRCKVSEHLVASKDWGRQNHMDSGLRLSLDLESKQKLMLTPDLSRTPG